MKVLWHSNAPFAPTGYGNQTNLFMAQMANDPDVEPVISCYFGLREMTLVAHDVRLLPAGLDDWGNDVLPRHVEREAPDVVWSLMDAWVLHEDVARLTALWSPVDHQPIPPDVLKVLRACAAPVAYSRFGEQEMRAAGLNPLYVPHAVDCSFYQPQDRAQARTRWGVEDDTFLAVTVAANKDRPPRKALDTLIKAWLLFVVEHPNAILYIHSWPLATFNGMPLPELIRFYGVGDTVRLPDAGRFAVGSYTPVALRDLYNAADVFVLPSRGEGFGIPIVEAQACGCPVIVTDFTAMSELCFGGYAIPVDWDDLVWTWQNSFQARVTPSAIAAGLEWAFENARDPAIRRQARQGAEQYDVRGIYARYMKPAFELLAEHRHDNSAGVEVAACAC